MVVLEWIKISSCESRWVGKIIFAFKTLPFPTHITNLQEYDFGTFFHLLHLVPVIVILMPGILPFSAIYDSG